ncbi:uncharacterized protein TRIADDRAFT_49643 [Trichoplax adhaerens]|uniref:DNA topoisomerase n=1 Tax=Trichoplax adhaerens TaxID=10228 RepID=B3RKZ5_TRIAD|nr:hypothetical protein TRIADDRAFT_49643 [Trichoplax adhaerens]EDV28672.1 hypothetical protein TRIADDRAFT_49643 [Trichoplax adhaerens]|eukprot:XP_002107874.1 hypothetical protein TRIADDRAFT_49643 [Trichoplax adhaerens]
MVVVLMIAEKPSLAQSIAKILSRGTMKTRKGIAKPCQVYEYSGTFHGQQARFSVTSVCGHVYSLDFLPQYNNWDAVDPVDLYDAEVKKKDANPDQNIVKFLKHEGQGIDYLVLWLDCDREGENICFEVIDIVKPVMRNSSSQNIFRAKFSAITDKDIFRAMETLITPNKNEALSVDARQELDLRIGCAFTRFQTKYFQGKYGDLDSSLISYGPCQTPTLGFCVERHDKINSFEPEKYWKIDVKVRHNNSTFALQWNRVRIFDKNVASMFCEDIKAVTRTKILKVTTTQKSKQKPIALNTVEMLRKASSGLNIGPHHTMALAERLYIQGYISYPRTETTTYPQNFDFRDLLGKLSSHEDLGDTVKSLLKDGYSKPKKGQDAGDHPPITPMKVAGRNELSGDSWRLYDYIVRHYLGSVMEDCRYTQTTYMVEISKESFTCSGAVVTSPGFLSVMNWLQQDEGQNLPNLDRGAVLEITEAKLSEHQTSPPDYLTESELITLMEKHGIGTDASIPVHINNICERNYVKITGSRRLQPTQLGIVLIHGYHKIDSDLALPTMRADVEKQLNLIAAGKADFKAVVNYVVDIFRNKFCYFKDSVSNMDHLFEVCFTKLAETGKPFCRCGSCNRYMKLIVAKPSRLYCKTCDQTYSLPQNGTIKLYKELKCPIDDFELVLFSANTGTAKAVPLCPACYTKSPYPDVAKNLMCNQCLHPTCPHSMMQNRILDCQICDQGSIVLDAPSAPKWRMTCNKCKFFVPLLQNASKVSVKEETCHCPTNIITIEFKDESPFPNGKKSHSGCLNCDEIFVKLIKLESVIEEQLRGGHRGHRQGRGGKRGRGRGRGKKR